MSEDPQPSKPDFTRREFDLREWMDEPCTFEEWQTMAGHLAKMNRLMRAHTPVLKFLSRVVQKRGAPGGPLHVVDVGCATGDALREIAKWAAKRGVALRLTGIDLNPYAARAAMQWDREEGVAAGTIEWITGDAFSAVLPAPMDVAISSIFTHHLPDVDVVRFLRWQEDQTRCGWIVSDLQRSERGFRMFGWMAMLLRWNTHIRDDGRASFRRAFTREDWVQYLREAGIAEGAVRVVQRQSGKLCLERLKEKKA